MPADFRTRRQGERATPPSAREMNAMLAAGRNLVEPRPKTAGPIQFNALDPTIIYVNNVSGADVIRGGVLGIDKATFDPAVDVDIFASKIVVDGKTPDITKHLGLFVVATEPIAKGFLGRAAIAGVVPVKLNLVAATDTTADIADTHADYLNSSTSGSAQIVWKQSATPGVMWALVRFGGTAPSAAICVKYIKDSTDGDCIIVHSWDGTTEGSVDIYAAKPYLNRQTPFDGETVNGVTYAYLVSYKRSATFNFAGTDQTITEWITPSYNVGDILYIEAAPTPGIANQGTPAAPVIYIDKNIDGRTWAQGTG